MTSEQVRYIVQFCYAYLGKKHGLVFDREELEELTRAATRDINQQYDSPDQFRKEALAEIDRLINGE